MRCSQFKDNKPGTKDNKSDTIPLIEWKRLLEQHARARGAARPLGADLTKYHMGEGSSENLNRI